MRAFRQAGALLGGGALALIALALLLNAPDNQAAEKRAPVSRRVAVSVAEARSGDMDQLVTALGTVTPRATVTVRSRVAGPIIELHFREGQHVEKGALLPARGKAQAKTGTYYYDNPMNGTSVLTSKAIAGWLTARSGRELLFCFMVNGVHLAQESDADKIGVELGRLCEIAFDAL